MESGAARAILDAWEQAVDEAPARRALTMLRTLAPAAAGPTPGELPAGRRNAALMLAHIELFGPRLDAVGECPQCGEPVELELDARALWQHATDSELGGEAASDEQARFTIEVDGLTIALRRLTAGDLVAAEAAVDPDEALTVMLDRCVLEVTRDGAPWSTRPLPDAAVLAVAQALEAADPGAELRLGMSCPACAQAWNEALDVGAFLWQEVEARALGLLREVDTLARAYGWTEPDVLGLSPRRRALYAELAEA